MLANPEFIAGDRSIVGSWIGIGLTLLIALASVLPLGISADGAGLVPHLALAPLFLASISDRVRVGPVGAFAAGLLVDVLTLAPLGVCAAAYVAFQGLAAREGAVLRDLPASACWLFFMPMAGAVASVHIAAMMLVGGVEPTQFEIGLSLVVTILAYPAVSIIAAIFRSRVQGRSGRTGSARRMGRARPIKG